MSALSAVLSTRVGRRRKFGEVSCTECTVQGNDLELIPTLEMKTRNPVESCFGSEFPAICNHCGDCRLKSQDINNLRNFCVFLEKRPLTINFSKFCPENCHRDTDPRGVFKFREIWPTGNR